MIRMIFASVLISVLGCGADEIFHTQNHNQRFVGLWMIDQPTHATYEATFYDLRPDGAVSVVHSIDLGGHLAVLGEVGAVMNPSGQVVCTFGDRWHSKDDAILVLNGDCSDRSAREIALFFSSAASRNAVGAQVAIETVGGETGWNHPGFPWAFRHCPDGADPVSNPRACE